MLSACPENPRVSGGTDTEGSPDSGQDGSPITPGLEGPHCPACLSAESTGVGPELAFGLKENNSCCPGSCTVRVLVSCEVLLTALAYRVAVRTN